MNTFPRMNMLYLFSVPTLAGGVFLKDSKGQVRGRAHVTKPMNYEEENPGLANDCKKDIGCM